MVAVEKLLGRIPERKPEQERFPLRAVTRPPQRTRRRWRLPRLLDQGATLECIGGGPCGTCVGHAFHHLLGASPTRIQNPNGPLGIYHRAQGRWDPWPGNWPAYDGTSIDAGAQTLLEWGQIESFHWAWSVEDAATFLLDTGPIVAGTSWLRGMAWPGADHIIRATGTDLGGHAYLIYGVDTRQGMFDIANSHGPEYGYRGKARLPFEDMRTLLASGGELCAVRERAA